MMIMEKPRSSMVLQCFIFVLVCLATCDSKWLEKENEFLFYLGDVININCSLDDSTKNVTLWKSEKRKGDYNQIFPNGHRILQLKQIFRVINLTVSDHGAYQCRAENMASLDVLTVHVSNDGIPKPKPKISVESSVAYGKDVNLKCSSKGHVELTWYKSKRNGTRNDWKLMNAEKSSTKSGSFGVNTVRVLVVKNFNVSDNGVYICELYRYSVKWRARDEKYLGIKGFQKPMFKGFSKSLYTVKPNQRDVDIDFRYTVEGIPTPLITWYKINGAKEENLTECYALEHYCPFPSDPSLDIGPTWFYKNEFFFPDDNATFKCVASNSLGTATKTFRINVLAKPKIAEKEKKFTFVQMYEGSPETELVCKVEEANPYIMNFIWQAQLSGCTNTDCKPNNSNWQTVTGKESGLKIVSDNDKSTITLEQSDQHFFYRCRAKNTVGEDYRVWKVVPVKGPQPLKAVKRLVDVNEGENVELSCEVAMFTSGQIDWSFNNVAVQQTSRTRMVNSSRNGTVYNTLHITKVNVSDAGKYKCSGMFGDVLVTDIIQLKVQESKAPSVSLESLTKKQNSSFIVHCNVSGHPKPEIIWKKNDKMVVVLDPIKGTRACKNTITGIYMLSNEHKDHANVLVICKADYKKHKGEYSCTARNRLGNDTAKARVNILAPPVIRFSDTTRQIALGEEFFVKCLASGNPKPHVWWGKKDKKTLKFKRVEKMHSDELHFDKLDESNLGDYRCFARNDDNVPTTRDFKIELSPVFGAVSNPSDTTSNKYPIVVGCVSSFIVLFVILVAVVLYKRKKAYGGFYILTLPPLPDYIKKLDPHTPLTEQTNKLPYDAEWEFPRNRLNFSRELGSGAFGKVFLADALGIVAFDPRGSTKRRSTRRRFGGSVRRNHYVNNNKMTKVAVKTLKEDSGETEYKDLLSELKILIHVGEHKNIVNLLGACTKGRESELWVIIEYCSNGNLLQFLRNRRDIYETEWKGVSKDPNVQLTMTDLVVVAYQVARGMEFLASRLCIHRDLATRNILVTDNYVIKIADFGLARDIGQDSQYVKTSTGLLPVKWMAIEAIVQRLFTEKSDVWSFGIVLWELFTLGGTPYPNIPPNEVAEFLVRGFRMEPPHACPDEISTLMMKCWEEDKESRPLFKELVQILDKMIELHTSSEGGCGYLEVQGEVMNEYLSPSEVKTPEMDPFQCNSPLPPIPSPGDNENDSLIQRDQNARKGKFRFDKAIPNKGRKDSEIEKMQNDHKPEIIKHPDVKCLRGSEVDGYIDTSLTGKEKERIEHDLEKDRDSSEEPHTLGDYAYWKKSLV